MSAVLGVVCGEAVEATAAVAAAGADVFDECCNGCSNAVCGVASGGFRPSCFCSLFFEDDIADSNVIGSKTMHTPSDSIACIFASEMRGVGRG